MDELKRPCDGLIRLEKDTVAVSAKLDTILKLLSEIQVQTAINTQSLQDHMRRTALLEVAVDGQEKRSYSLATRLYTLVGIVTVIQAIVLFIITKI